MDTLGSRIRYARKLRKGLTQAAIAAFFGIDRVSVTQWESDQTRPSSDKMPELASLLQVETNWLISGVGQPPDKYPLMISSYDPDTDEDHRHDPDWQDQSAALIDGQIHFIGNIPGSSPEVAARPGAGIGQHDAKQARIVSQGIASGHEVVSEWVIPSNYVRHTLDARPSGIIIMSVVGHSMEPLLNANDRILVDTSQNVWMGDAVYVIDDGDGVLQVKTIRKVTSSSPARFRIISEAYPGQDTPRKADEFRIVGRVVGRFTSM